MNILNISLFGNMRVRFSDGSSEIRLTHSIQQLLAYLLLRRDQPLARDLLADLFWSEYDQEHAHGCLNTALWRLRNALHQKQLGGAQQYLFTDYLGEVGFNSSVSCWIDIVEFEACWQRIRGRSRELTQQDVSNLDRLIELYQGDLLEGFYNDWILSERERFRLIYLDCLARLMDHYHHERALERSVEYGHRILALDPLREDIHRTVMQLYLELGWRGMAVRQYKICFALLKDELNIDPMAETEALYKRVLRDRGSSVESRGPVDLPVTDVKDGYWDALNRIERAIKSFESARDNLYQAMQALQRQFGSSEQDLRS